MTRLALILALAVMLAAPALSHSEYMDWKRPDNGGSCCNNTDCDVVAVRFIDGARHVVWRGQTLPAPDATLLDIPSHDSNSHACVIAGVVRCLVIGGGV